MNARQEVGASNLDFACFEAVTFDCYGTLIDWETGILRAMGTLLEHHSASKPDSDGSLLELFGELESAAEGGSFRSYRLVMESVAREFGARFGFEVTDGEAAGFAASVSTWLPFADVRPALETLGRRYRLGVVSNIDDDLFAGTAALLGIRFDEVVTAEQVESYKPAPAHFREMMRRLGLPAEKILHVAQSLYHDIATARELGIACVWVNRRSGRPGGGATRSSDARPDLEVSDLATLVDLVRAE